VYWARIRWPNLIIVNNFEKNSVKKSKNDDFENFYYYRFLCLLQVLKIYSSHHACLIFVYSVFFNFTFLTFIIWLIVISIIKSPYFFIYTIKVDYLSLSNPCNSTEKNHKTVDIKLWHLIHEKGWNVYSLVSGLTHSNKRSLEWIRIIVESCWSLEHVTRTNLLWLVKK